MAWTVIGVFGLTVSVFAGGWLGFAIFLYSGTSSGLGWKFGAALGTLTFVGVAYGGHRFHSMCYKKAMKTCPFCQSMIPIKATVCSECTRDLPSN